MSTSNSERARVQLYWPGRDEPVTQLAEQLDTFLAGLASAVPELAHLAPCDRREAALRPLPPPGQRTEVLRANTVRYQLGGREVVSYTPRFALRRASAPDVEFKLYTGVPAMPIAPVFAPNRLEFYARGGAMSEPGVLYSVLRAGVLAFAPRWGYVGTEHTPSAPVPVFSPDVPVVGWITYLDKSFALGNVRFPESVRCVGVNSHGTAIVAGAERFDPSRAAHCEALAGVESALRAAGVLG